MSRPVLLYPHASLDQKCLSVDVALAPNWGLIGEMFDTMSKYDGMGLAANQIGIDTSIFVMKCSNQLIAVANPAIEIDGDFEPTMESCLSLPGIVARVPRWSNAKLKCHIAHSFDNQWDYEELELCGTEAQCAQHEIEHLNGKIFIDHLDRASRGFIVSLLSRKPLETNLR